MRVALQQLCDVGVRRRRAIRVEVDRDLARVAFLREAAVRGAERARDRRFILEIVRRHDAFCRRFQAVHRRDRLYERIARGEGDLRVDDALIFGRDILFADEARRNQEVREDAQHDRADKDGPRSRENCREPSFGVAAANRVEALVEPADWFPRLPGRFQGPKPGKRRRDREGDEQRRQGRDGDDDRELGEFLPDLPAGKGDRQEHDHVDHRDHHGGVADFGSSVEGCVGRSLAARVVAFDIFQDDGGVVDENADYERHGHE